MEENLADMLVKTADVLHWLGKYRECNALVLLSRLLRARKIDTLADLDATVAREEAAAP